MGLTSIRSASSVFTKVFISGALGITLTLSSLLPAASLLTQKAYAAPLTIFSDSFESGDFTAWDYIGTNWDTVNGDAQDGSWRAQFAGSSPIVDMQLKKNLDTTGYHGIKIEFYYQRNGLEAGEYGQLGYETGTSSHTPYQFSGTAGPTDDDAVWQFVSYTFPAHADNNPNFSFNFAGLADAAGDHFRIDKVSITGEPSAPALNPTVTATNFNTHSGTDYKGFNVGFTLNNDFSNVTDVKVELFKGGDLLVSNTDNQNLLDLINGGETSLSTPFIVQNGTYTETHWNLGSRAWTATDKPTKAVISVTDETGTYTAENTSLSEPNGWTFESLLPYAPPSTNIENKTNGWAHVNHVSSTSDSVTLEFVNPRTFASCFEYRTDGDTSQKKSDTNYNTDVTDGLYPFYCQNNNSRTGTIAANEYVEVRMVFGAEDDERFDWTRFDVTPPVDPTDSHQLSLSGDVYRDIALNNCDNLNECKNQRTNEMLADWEMHLYKEDAGTWQLVGTDTTDASGIYKFAAQKSAGIYHVCEVLKAGWTQPIQTWTGSGYLVATANQSGDATEGSYCTTTTYDDTADRSSKSHFGNVDTKKPFTEVLSPASNGIYNSSFDVNVRSTDNESGIVKAVANLYDTSGLINSCVNQTVSPAVNQHDYTCHIDANSLADGDYFLKINTKDGAGLTSNTVTWNFTIDKTAPTVEITAPAEGSLQNGAVQIRGTVTDDNPRHYYIKVTKQNGAAWNNVFSQTVLSGSFTNQVLYTLPANADGVYKIQLAARDAAGGGSNTGNRSGDVYRTFTVDNTDPQKVAGVHILDANNNDLGCNGTTNLRTITVDWDDSTDPNFDHYQYDTKSGWKTTLNPSQRTGDIQDLDGEYKYRIRAFDAAGNNGEWSEWCYVTLDRVAPIVTIDPIADGTDTTPTISGTTDETNVNVIVNGVNYFPTVNLDGTWSVTTNVLGVGPYTATATSTDAAGNTGSANDDFSVNATLAAVTPTQATGGRGAGDQRLPANGNLAVTNFANNQETGNDNKGDKSDVKADTTNGENQDEKEAPAKNDKEDKNFVAANWWWLLIALGGTSFASYYYFGIVRREQ